MIPQTCPLKDKSKLNVTLLGECEFAIFLPKKYCKKCPYEKKAIANMLSNLDLGSYDTIDTIDTIDTYEG